AFGDDPGVNRRVGIGVSDMPAQPSVEEDAARWLRRHPSPLGAGLRLDVDPTLAARFTAPTPAVVAPSIPRFGILDWQLGDPNRLLDRSGPVPPPALTPLPVTVVGPDIP